MSTSVERNADSIITDVHRIKEENAAEYGFNLRKIAAAAQARQREHPERMVTRIPSGSKLTHGQQPLTRVVQAKDL